MHSQKTYKDKSIGILQGLNVQVSSASQQASRSVGIKNTSI